MIKKINGSWLELHHFGLPEGKYFNDACHNFSDEQWKAKIDEMAELKMTYIVIMANAYTDKEIKETYYDNPLYKKSTMVKANDPLEAIFSQCDKNNMKVFLSTGMYAPWMTTFENMTTESVFQESFAAMEVIYKKFGHHKSFYGWYFPDESEISKYFDEEFITYVNRYSEKAHQIDKNLKTLIAPYGTCKLVADDHYVEQLKRLDVDFVAYQDEIGVKKTTVNKTPIFYKNLRRAHDAANRSKLWADVESFTFEGDVYRSALLPKDINILIAQLEAVSEYVDEILIFEYQGMFNKPNTTAFCGHPDSYRYYNEYKKLLDEIENQ